MDSGASKQTSDGTAPEFLAGGGAMGERIRSHAWRETPLGEPDSWPHSLRAAASIMLNSRYPIALYWGEDLTLLYNDAWTPIPGGKHPWALGRPARDVWPEIWNDIEPLFARVFATGEGTWSEDQLLPMYRHGYTEECYFNFTFSPVRGSGGKIDGIFNAVVETTDRVIGERRLRTLSDLGARMHEARDGEEACRRAAAILAANDADVPFALIYLAEADGKTVRLAGIAGAAADANLAPETIELQSAGAKPWPIGDVIDRREAIVIDRVEAKLLSGRWHEPVKEVVVLPLTASGAERIAGAIVAGVNPRQRLDARYRSFFDLLAGHVATAISNARAFEAERRRAAALAEIDRAKTAFFSNASHEFRTPLTLMLAPLSDALANPDISGALRGEIELVHRNGLRLLKLVNSLLDFARIEAGRAQASFAPVDLGGLTEDLASSFRSAMERAGLAYVVAVEPLGEPVYVDADMWEKIVLNLLSNAFKFTLSGQVRVRLAREGNSAVLEVADTGAGIPAGELPHLFERFHRVEGVRGRTHEGTGIGLAFVYELVKLHGGSIVADSTEGSGTTFRVSLPFGVGHLPAERVRATRTLTSTATGAQPFVQEALRWLPDAHDAQRLEPSPAPHLELDAGTDAPRAKVSEGAYVLLADDNADMRDYLKRLLMTRFDVHAVNDGAAVLDAVRTVRPDLVISDVMMPNVDGLELARRLRADPATEDIPVILLSARAGEEAMLEGLSAGADDYLTKPFSSRELLGRASAQIERSRLQRALRAAVARESDARAAAERASLMKDEFLATLSHELRTPLNAIVGWSQILNQQNARAEDVRQGLAAIDRNARMQTRMIEDLLDMSRIVSGKVRLDVQRVNLADVIEQAIETVLPSANARSLRLLKVLDPNAGPVMGDPSRLEQIVWNLLSNAIKFTPKGGKIHVVLERVNSHLEIGVTDNGEGIDAEFLPYIFDRFRQADASTTRRHGGLGLGLSIVKQLVELHGGRIVAKSAGVNQGATFLITLPVAPAVQQTHEQVDRRHPRAETTGAQYEAPNLKGVKVLVVDDDADARAVIQRMLAEPGAEVTTASSAAEALTLLSRERHHVLLSDIGMPGEDGYELIRKVRSLPVVAGGQTPAVALTAFARSEDRRRSLLAGYQMHVAKPVDRAELLAVVASLSGRVPLSA
jgi:signal transduction histidine kinase